MPRKDVTSQMRNAFNSDLNSARIAFHIAQVGSFDCYKHLSKCAISHHRIDQINMRASFKVRGFANLILMWMAVAVSSNPVVAYEIAAQSSAPLLSPQNPITLPKGIGPSILFDADSGEVLAEDRSGEAWYPASLTKVMTAFVVFTKIRDGKLRLDQQITVSELANAQAPSKVGIPPGKTVTVDWALQALLVYSANDMAYVLAEAASGSISEFAKEMNAAAKAMGMSASHFVNPNGLFDPRQVISARDLGVLAAVTLKEYPQYARYFDQDYLVIGKRKLANRNSLLREMPEADGMKTGFVCNSAFNLVASATRDGRKLMAIVLGTKSGQARMLAARSLLEQGFARTPDLRGTKIATLSNIDAGKAVPLDMTATVCPRKNPVLAAEIELLNGWAVSLGTFNTAAIADVTLRDYMLTPAGRDAPATGGVLKLPDAARFAAIMWGMNRAQSEDLCKAFRSQGSTCEVKAPVYLATIASAEAQKRVAVKQKRRQPAAQGSDSTSKKKKRVRK
jgi:D-alanyl-D-alanine carboxypeptidase